MLGTLINTGTVVAGASIGLLLRKKLPQKYTTIFFQCVGLYTLVLGIQMAISIGNTNTLIVIFSLIVGGLTGEFCRIDERMNSAGETLKHKFKIGNDRFAEGFVTAFLLFCMGTMSILGPLEEGITGNYSKLLEAKSIMDGFSSLLLASAMGIGVLFAALPLLIYQGSITLLAGVIGDKIPEAYINGITAIGGIMLIGLAITILNVKKISVMDMMPALVYICIFLWLSKFVGM
ncbi:MAG: DUF554 domain-containing protein [Ignavibacteria bacterium]|jgi:uncharacterized membrane protein YqgA involved in biofilm formation|nr:DUF554 domain-containing protein [Ignavibacteria bacterium]